MPITPPLLPLPHRINAPPKIHATRPFSPQRALLCAPSNLKKPAASVPPHTADLNRQMAQKLRITIVEPDQERARMIVDGLCDAGDFTITVLGNETSLEQRLTDLNPDVVLVDIANPSRDSLESLSVASGANKRPVAMFVDRSDPEMTKAAIEAGLSAYVVDGLTKNRIKPVIDAAIARFHMVAQIRNERDAAKSALADRKTIDRAKGLLIAAKGISEEEAYTLLRTTAMNQGRKTADVANALVMASEMLK